MSHNLANICMLLLVVCQYLQGYGSLNLFHFFCISPSSLQVCLNREFFLDNMMERFLLVQKQFLRDSREYFPASIPLVAMLVSKPKGESCQ